MMDDGKPVIDLDILPAKKGRKGDGGTYLVVADGTAESLRALHFACSVARAQRAHVGILAIAEAEDFQHWGAVAYRMKKELRDNAEKFLWTVAGGANEFDGTTPSLYIGEGEAGEAIITAIDADENIVRLILASAEGHAPGPLVSFCTGKGLSRLRVPVVIVPPQMKDFS